MTHIILASHGSLAEGVKSAVSMIIGDCQHIHCYSLDYYKNPQDILQAVTSFMDEAKNDNFIILSDIKGGSVHNQLLTLCVRNNVYLASGMNLNLVLELSMLDEKVPIPQAMQEAIQIATENIAYFDACVLQKKIANDTEDSLW